MIIKGVHINDKGNPVDRFDLEEAIQTAWRISDDIKALYNSSEYMNEDQMMNALLGLEIFAEMRFQSLWSTYEQCLHNGGFNDGARRAHEITKAMDEAVESFGQEKL